MAGDWIKMRTNLCGDPGVKAMSRTLKLDTFSVVGRLHEFWAWADQHTDDGVLEFTVLEDIDDVVQKRGFAAELVRVGWLIDNGQDGVEIPKWDRHNGDSAKKRCQAQERMGRMRQRRSEESVAHLTSRERNGCDDLVTPEESQRRNQRREEKSNTPISPQGDTVQEGSSDDSDALLIRAKSLFLVTGSPRLPIRLDSSQLRAWKKNKAAVAATSEEDWQLLEEAYRQKDGPAATYRRKDLAQLLNNWVSEIQRAADWKSRTPGWGAGRAASAPLVPPTRSEPPAWRAAYEAQFGGPAPDLPWDRLPDHVQDLLTPTSTC